MKRISLLMWMVLLAGSVDGCSRAEKAPAPNTAAPSVALVTARTSRVAETVAATGRFGATAGAQAHLAFSEPGVLASVDVTMGDRVAQGETVASLDATKLALAAEQADAEVRAADAGRRQAQVDHTSAKIALDDATLARAKRLYAAGVGPRKDIDEAQARIADDRADAASAHAGVGSSQAQVEGAQWRSAIAHRDLAQATLTSPLSGVVGAVLRRPGEWVDAGTPVLLIAPAQGNDLTLTVAADDVARVRAGQIVHYTVTGTGARGSGTVIGVAPMVDPQSQSGNVAVRTETASTTPGSTVEATIETADIEGIVLPEAAVVQDPQTQKTVVFVVRRQTQSPSRFEQREVHVRANRGGQVIVSGIRPGDRVASEGAFALLAPADSGGD